MWEKLKTRIIALLSVTPFVGAIIWQTIEWFLNGMKGTWWESAFKSTEVLVGIVVSVVIIITNLIYYVQHLGALKKLPDLEKKLDEVKNTGIEAVQAATGFIDRAFGLLVMTELREKHSRAMLEALQALGFNLRNWENHLTTKKNNKIVLIDDDKKIVVWLRYMRTYYFEEAFDIRRKELVTNGRNFCFLLLATLQAFLEQLGEQEVLHYYAVTPVHPKDWYNWPHGHFKPRAYFEEDFIGLFHRLLRETLKSPAVRGKLIHRRFLLTSYSVPKDAQPFGWALDDYSRVQRQLRETWMLPVAVPVYQLQDASCEVLKAFGTYYDWLSRRFPASAPNNQRNERLVVPLFCSSWSWDSSWFTDISNGVGSNIGALVDIISQSVRDAWNKLHACRPSGNCGKCPVGNCCSELVRIARGFHESKVTEAMKNINPPDGYCWCKEAYNQIREATNAMITGGGDVLDFARRVHHYDVLLSEHDAREQQENLKLLLHAVLRLRDCQLISNSSNPSWDTLGNVFGNTLHSAKEECWLVGLDTKAQQEWYQTGVKPEFSFFGISTEDGSPQWKLVLATDLDYPFEVAKIRIIEPDDPEWKKYEAKINHLVNKNKEYFHFIHLGEVLTTE